MKKISVVSFFALVLFFSNILFVSAAEKPPNNSATSAIVIDANSKTVIFKQNADTKSLIASTTKMMTAMIVLENCSCDETVEIKPEYTNIEGSSLYLRTGEIFTVKELLYGLMLASGNDAAVALAYHTAGGIEKFAELMNKKAAELLLENSSFKNPHGLDEEGHYSTAEDLAKIAAAAMKNEIFKEIVSTKSIAIHERVLANHNKLLWKYKDVVGIKTGYTMKSGRSLVSCAERDGMSIIIVTINDRSDWNDHMALYDWIFANYKSELIASAGKTIYMLPVISGETDCVSICAEEELKIFLEKDQDFVTKIFLPKFIYAPVKSGDIIGKIEVYLNDKLIGQTNLIAVEDISCDNGNCLSFWEKTLKNFLLMFKD